MSIKINRVVCQACFVHDLANWHISCCASFSKHWSISPIRLSVTEKKALKHLTSIFQKYLKTTDELWMKELWKNSNKPIVPKETKSAFQILTPRFEYFYTQQVPNMKRIQLYLGKFQQKYSTELEKTRQFYNFKGGNQTNTYLTLSFQANREAGGTLIDLSKNNQYVIFLKFGDFHLSDDNWPLENVYLHEMGHVYQCTESFENLIKENTKRVILPLTFKTLKIKPEDILTELVHTSLWGQTGYLSQQIYGKKILPKKLANSYQNLTNQVAFKLNDLTKNYIGQRQNVDNNFIETAIKVWNEAI